MSVLGVVGVVLGTLFVLGSLAVGGLFLAYLYADGFRH
ncbi:hypothetical protein ABIC30_000625 [Methylobacterium sp. 1030]